MKNLSNTYKCAFRETCVQDKVLFDYVKILKGEDEVNH